MRLSLVALAAFSAASTAWAQKPASGWDSALAAFRAGDYAKAARLLPASAEALPKNRDYFLYFLGEAEFYAGSYGKAAKTFAELSKLRDSRFAGVASWRAADCLWMDGQRSRAATEYRKLLAGKPPWVDRAVARFRLAEVQAESIGQREADPGAAQAAARAYRDIHVDYPAHPLGVEAGRRALLLATSAKDEAQAEPSPEERLQRAATLSKGHHWQAALEELSRLPAHLPEHLAIERDLAMGMAKYQARRDYAGAADLLLGVAPKLSGEKAARAAFHGARALSRIDRDDEAIVNYRAVVARYPGTAWAAEAQFRAGWLEINRGRFREAVPDLQQTLARYPKSAFADDAAWYLALAHYLIGDFAQALSHLATYEGIAAKASDDKAMRVRYWRARIFAQTGRKDDATKLLRECADRLPFNYYALLCRARLRELGETAPWPTLPEPSRRTDGLRDPAIDRARELRRAGLGPEAGVELERHEKEILRRGGKRALPALLATYQEVTAFNRAHELAESSSGAPGEARLLLEASYPRAYAESVERYGKATGNPDLFIYAIMRKESSYQPFAVSSADARGLLQLLPSTGEQIAKKLGLATYPDELFDPDTNVHLGAAYLGGLLQRFRGQEALAAGAYNAGARAMMRWCDQWGNRSFDEFVELITYDQAREYIKRVLGIYARYRHLYSKPLELSLALDTKYLKEGIDF